MSDNILGSFSPLYNDLAEKIGLNEAIVLGRIHFFLQTPRSGKEVDGKRWIYNTMEDWQAEHFRFWSLKTVRRIISGLESSGLLLSRSDLSTGPKNRTKWYSIDYDLLDRLTKDEDTLSYEASLTQSVQGNLTGTINKKTRTEEKEERQGQDDPITLSASSQAEKQGVSNQAQLYEAAKLAGVEVPPHLDTPSFAEAWNLWESHRREKKIKLTPTSVKLQLKDLAKHSEPVAVAMLEQAVRNGWTGIYELKNTRPEPSKPRPWTPLGYNEQEQPRANGAARPWTPLGG